MTHDPRCPSCGHVNPAEASHCERCNFPLREVAPGEAPARPVPGREPAAEISMQRIRPIRPRRPTGPEQQLKVQLWLALGTLAMAAVLYTAWQGFQKSNAPVQQVEGAKPEQQQAADRARAE